MNSASAPLAHQFDDVRQQRVAAELGMWTFLATEVLFFGGFLFGYAIYRSWYPRAFAAGSAHLNLWLGGVNTAVLLTSSLTMALAIDAVRHNRRRRGAGLLVATMALGSIFLGIKADEYHEKFVEHLVPGRSFAGRALLPRTNDGDAPAHEGQGLEPLRLRRLAPSGSPHGPLELFFSFYFALTGLHAIHMVIGLGVVAVMLSLTVRGRVSASYDTPLEMAGLYWHLVDIVWIFLYPLLYLIH